MEHCTFWVAWCRCGQSSALTECSFERGTGKEKVWYFYRAYEAYKREMVEPHGKGKDLIQMM